MDTGRDTRWRRYGSISLLAGSLLVAGHATGAERDASFGVTAALELSQAQGESANTVTLRLRNDDSNGIVVHGPVELLERFRYQRIAPEPAVREEPEDPGYAPPPPLVPTSVPSHLQWLDELPLPSLLEPGETLLGHLVLVPPHQPGAYKELVRVRWRYEPGASKDHSAQYSSEAQLFYAVTRNGRTRPITEDQYHRANDREIPHRLLVEGQPERRESVLGYRVLETAINGAEEARTLYEVPLGAEVLWNDEPSQQTGEILDLQVCVRVTYLDNFASCPSDPTGMLWWQPYCDLGETPHLGLEVELWDADSDSADDFIGRYALDYGARDGYSCINFEWNQALRGENHPDVYLTTRLNVHDTNDEPTDRRILLCKTLQRNQDECSDPYHYSWRADYIPNVKPAVTPLRTYNFGPATEVWNKRAMGTASAQKFLRTFRGLRMTDDISIAWNDDACSDEDGTPWPCALNDRWFTLTNGLYQRWETAPHEAGHAYQMQLFEQDTLTGEPCPNPHYVDRPNNESCATREGWAQFVATVSWFPTERARDEGRPTYSGETIEGAPAESSDPAENARTEVQVIRTLWDLYDRSPDGLDTADVSQDRAAIVRTWDEFANGTANHRDREDGPDGCNLRDFEFNAGWDDDVQSDVRTAMQRNDTDGQSPD